MSKFIPTEKYLDLAALALKYYCNLIVAEGSVRSSKTVFFKPAFMFAVLDSDEENHLIAANDLDAINDNILGGQFGLLNMFSEYLTLQKDEIGGYYVHVKATNGKLEKKILLAGFSTVSKWKKILGKTFGVILVDEVNTANEQFIDECFMRQASVKRPLQLWTLNGDIPSHWVYVKYINRCNIVKKYRDKVPASIIADMDNSPKQKGWYYFHFTFDDNPSLNEEQKERTRSIFPIGSYYYTIKVLGERGSPGEMIYVDYLSNDLVIDPYELDAKGKPKYVWSKFTIGVDIAESRAFNSFALIGWTYDYSKCCVMDLMTFKGIGYDEKKMKLMSFVMRHLEANRYIECVSVDSAEANFIADLKAQFYFLNVRIVPSNKATIKLRIDMNIIGLSSKRLFFSKHVMDAFNAFLVAKWVDDKKGIEREDNNQKHNDIIDSVEYGQTVHMQAFMKALNGREVI